IAWARPAARRSARNPVISPSATNRRSRKAGDDRRWSKPTTTGTAALSATPLIALSELGESVLEGLERHLGLLARIEIANRGRVALELVLADEDGGARVHLVRMLEPPRHIAAIAKLDREAGAAQVFGQGQRPRLALLAHRHDG